MTFYLYAVGSNQADRITLDQKASTDGQDAARVAWPHVLSGAALREYGKQQAEEWLDEYEGDEDQELTDDEEEFIARYGEGYAKGYQEVAEELSREGDLMAAHRRAREREARGDAI